MTNIQRKALKLMSDAKVGAIYTSEFGYVFADEVRENEVNADAVIKAFMTHQEYTFARRALIGGSKVVIATVPISEQRIRIIQLRTMDGQYQGKYLADGKWYPVYKVEF